VNDSVRLLISQLSTLEDPRQAGKVTYPPVEISMLTVAGVIADCDGVSERDRPVPPRSWGGLRAGGER
jgi:hypothetical protein